MQNEKLQINFAPGMAKAELVLREGVAPKELDPKAPVKTKLNGVIGAVVEYLTKRINTEQFAQKDCHILVNRENIEITLIINEADEYKRGEIVGKLGYNPKFVEFGINGGKVWTPTELGMFIKMNRAFFADRAENMKLVSCLMNFTADVNNKIDRAVKENGNRTDNFAQVVNSNLPESFTIQMPIFKGMQPETIEVETFAQVNGREVAFILLSPGAQATLEDLRDKVIDEQLKQIREIAPEIAIIEV
ncbi:MAG: protein of unknown function DUF2303 [Bacteriophage sp.]|jgi:hypothetical protein|nr:MAG: protein of unknown function DUF2303 [Bacteriophage sp.]UWG95114.1 MAG: protein of unknown function DUF2303 [Bacteriophage sp.]UWI02481.1 MAG: protein of unknown function DUF2303 [Bacteriophage sp.]